MTNRAVGLLLSILVLSGAGTAASAQGLRGIVRSGDIPVSGAVVELVRPQDSMAVAHALTRGDGSFHLNVQATPAMWLRTRAIGFRPVVTPIGPPVNGGSEALTIQLATSSFVLADVEVRASRKACSQAPGSSALLAEVFELVQTTNAIVSRHLGSPDLRFTVELHFRDSLAVGISDSTITYPEHAMLDWPVRAPSLERLQQDGFSRPKAAGEGVGRWFYGLDLEVLQTDWFAGQQCFWVTSARAEDGQDVVVLHFEPADGLKQPSVEGTVLVRTTDWSVQRLEYRHVNLPSWYPRGSSGGMITFDHDGDGVWYPSSWRLRSPIENDPSAGISRPSLVGGVFAQRPRSRAVIGVAEVRGQVTGVRRVQR